MVFYFVISQDLIANHEIILIYKRSIKVPSYIDNYHNSNRKSKKKTLLEYKREISIKYIDSDLFNAGSHRILCTVSMVNRVERLSLFVHSTK